jgi:NADPH:quinone reductase-like Zn-dependent oxidoreductase
MKAIVYHKYGSPDVLNLEDVDIPAPEDNQVLVKVHAVSINRSDWEGLTGKPLYARLGGLIKPNNRIPGSDIAGIVEAVGKDVRQFKVGDEVFGLILNYAGGFAEYACMSERALALKPAGMTFEEAAAIPQAAFIALQGIREKGQVQAGQKVLINGAAGGTGTFAIQLAKLTGAEVTGVDNAEKQEFMRSLGADHVIDYAKEDFTKNGQQYDLILDVIANRSVFAYRRTLRPSGSYFMAGGSVATLFQMLLLGGWIRRTTGKRIRLLVVETDPRDLVYMTELIEAGKVKLVIDKCYSLGQAAEALRYLGEGHAKGKIVITVEHNNDKIR